MYPMKITYLEVRERGSLLGHKYNVHQKEHYYWRQKHLHGISYFFWLRKVRPLTWMVWAGWMVWDKNEAALLLCIILWEELGCAAGSLGQGLGNREKRRLPESCLKNRKRFPGTWLEAGAHSHEKLPIEGEGWQFSQNIDMWTWHKCWSVFESVLTFWFDFWCFSKSVVKGCHSYELQPWSLLGCRKRGSTPLWASTVRKHPQKWMVRSQQQLMEGAHVHSHRSVRTQKKPREMEEDSRLPIVEFQTFDSDI